MTLNENLNKAKVLIVDDEPSIIRTLTRVLKPHFEVFSASSGEDALTIIRHNQIHVILSDQKMPVMTGVQLLSKVKLLSSSTVRILLTGYSELDDVVASVNEGEIYRYINKPWDNDNLIDVIAEAARASMQLPQTISAPESVEALEGDVKSDTVLVVSDSVELISEVERLAGGEVRVKGYGQTKDCLKYISQEAAIIIIIEITLFSREELDFISSVKLLHPHILTVIITTAEKDSGKIIALINEGKVYRYLSKPHSLGQLRLYLSSAMQYQKKLMSSPQLMALHGAVVDDNKELQTDSLPTLAKKFFSALANLKRNFSS